MTAKEAARLISWLVSNGFTSEQAEDCIMFIAYGNEPCEKPTNEQSE